jgi:hypothetical protein
MDIVQLVISACHANAKHPKSRPTEAPRSHLYPTLLSCFAGAKHDMECGFGDAVARPRFG